MKNDKKHVFFGIMFMLFYVFVCSTGGYFITNLIFKIQTQNVSLSNHIIMSFITFLFAILISLTTFGKRGIKHQKDQYILFDNVIEALEQISSGNFNVFVELNENYKRRDDEKDFTDIVGSINKMARELGAMEHLRQDFISNVSHEIGSPLTSIKGFTVLLRNSKLNEKEINHYLDIIEEETNRLSKLSENFLKLSNLEENENVLNKVNFNLDNQIENVILMLEPQWKEKKQELIIKLDKIKINADKDLLYEVWSNVIGNSIKFTNSKGKIKISLKTDKEFIICEISDNGIGIAKQDKMHIFERFYKSDKSRTRLKTGNGLGLSIVKKIIDLHNGSINVESKLGEGTTFIIKLPVLK